MSNLSWLKIVPYFVIAGLVWWALDTTYNHGREFERAICADKEAKANRESFIKSEILRADLESERNKADRRATQIIGAYANEITKLHTDLTDAADHRLYITAKAASCEADRSAMSSGNKDTGGNAGKVRFEIHEEVAREIWQDGLTVEGLEIKHNSLINLIKTRPDCFEVVR